jgi:hypothetical protein
MINPIEGLFYIYPHTGNVEIAPPRACTPKKYETNKFRFSPFYGIMILYIPPVAASFKSA